MFTQITSTLGEILAPLHGNDSCSRKGPCWKNLLGIVGLISSERFGRLLLAAIISPLGKINFVFGISVQQVQIVVNDLRFVRCTWVPR